MMAISELSQPISLWARAFAEELNRLNEGRFSQSILIHQYARTLEKAALDGLLTVRESPTMLAVTVTANTPPDYLFNGVVIAKADLQAWASAHCPEMQCRLLGFEHQGVKEAIESTPAEEQDDGGEQVLTWQEEARRIADECFDRDTANNCRDSLGGYARRVMDEMRRLAIHGPRGPFTNPKTIQRDALQNNLWWATKKK